MHTYTHTCARTHTTQTHGFEQHQTKQNICRMKEALWQPCPDTRGDKPNPSHADGRVRLSSSFHRAPITPLSFLLHLKSTMTRYFTCSHFLFLFFALKLVTFSLLANPTRIRNGGPKTSLCPHRILSLTGTAMANRETDTATPIDPRHRVAAETLTLGGGNGGSGGEATEVFQRKRALKDEEGAQGLPVSLQEAPGRQQAPPCTLALVPSPSPFALQAKKTPFHPSKPPSGSSPPPGASAILASPPQLSLSTCTSSFEVRSNAIF